MMKSEKLRRGVGATLLALAALTSNALAADDPCQAFKWDLSRERALFAAPAAAPIDGNAMPPAAFVVDQAVDIRLRPQASLKLPVPSAKPMLTDGAWAGFATFTVPRPGLYRIALDSHLWIDVLDGTLALTSVDFGGPGSKCPAPQKVVIYDLPAGKLLTLQISDATEPRARVIVTRVP